MKKYRKIKAQANVNLLCFFKILNKKFTQKTYTLKEKMI